jgi:hypothetical protein
MDLNSVNCRDLEFICEAAAKAFRDTQLMPAWELKAETYRRLFFEEFKVQRSKETETHENRPTETGGS